MKCVKNAGLTQRLFQTFSKAMTTPHFSATGISFSIALREASVAWFCASMYCW